MEQRQRSIVKILSRYTVLAGCWPEVDGIDMVQCNQCQEWFHLGCVAVPDEAMSDSATEWFCPTCA